MEVLSFVLVSMLEWFALILLTFTMFKLDIRDYVGQIVFSSFLLALVSYVLIVTLDLLVFATFLQPPIVFIFYWQMFRIPVFYAGLIMTNGYLAYILLTTIVYNTVQLFGLILKPDTLSNFSAQALTAFVAMLAAWLIHKFRVGYTFVPYGDRANVRLNKINMRLLLFTVVGYVVMTSFNFLYFLGNYKQLVLVPVILSLGVLQYWVLKREISNEH
ncbi:hypothetical protein [Paenibacillus flagellatus]|uniref:Uncharacterized protein n=1 Tax=Paenibacillus flagellatus TaxID=2211139 RepID=A0A2V5JXN1_9BACL|nr:hypothetical protein [Paenibacillus flagellatus]PYI51558.1 hypothetical protein DLM86_24390 [Paenibacillus flagellatus]